MTLRRPVLPCARVRPSWTDCLNRPHRPNRRKRPNPVKRSEMGMLSRHNPNWYCHHPRFPKWPSKWFYKRLERESMESMKLMKLMKLMGWKLSGLILHLQWATNRHCANISSRAPAFMEKTAPSPMVSKNYNLCTRLMVMVLELLLFSF